MKDDAPALVCERCGRRAIVHIRPDAAEETIRHLCLDCADAESTAQTLAKRDRKLDHAAILVVVGSLVLVISLLADVLAFGSAEGFGVQQAAGMGLGVFLFLIGVMARVPTVVVLGFITVAITLLADWLSLGDTEGFGTTQMLGTFLGLALIVAGLLAGRRRKA